MLLDERMPGFGSEIEGMRDESFRSNPERPTMPSHEEETEGVNEIVLSFNTELDSADLSDPVEFSTWRDKAEYVRKFNPDEGAKLLGMLNEKLKEQNGH